MATALRPIGHEDRLSLVEHLDELRTRLIVSAAFFGAAFALCAWQSSTLLNFVNRPLERSAVTHKTGPSRDPLEQSAFFERQLRTALLSASRANRRLALTSTPLSAGDRQALTEASRALAAAARAAPGAVKKRPVTLGVAEPFVTTLTVAGYAALLLALPFLLYQLYAFVLPAFSPRERRLALPLMAMVPVLFLGGVAFGYFLALPPAIKFLQNFNDQSFDILIQAKDYYRFVILLLAGMGLVFQIPVGVLLLTRMGVVDTRKLRSFRRYAIVIAAIVAAVVTPSVDPVTMLVTMVPLIVLYELSILLSTLVGSRKDDTDEPEADADELEAAAAPPHLPPEED